MSLNMEVTSRYIYPLTSIICLVVIFLKPTVSRLPIAKYCPEICICDDIVLHVNCSYAGLTRIPEVNNNTRSLILDGNQLTVIRKNFFTQMSNLRYVSLADNEIDEIEDNAFRNQRKLVKLDLSGNHFGEVPSGALQYLRILKHLDLRYNQIRTLSKDPWYQLKGLESLRLDNNSIQNIPMVMTRQLRKIRDFTISNNVIDAIPSNQFKNSTKLKYLDLSSNQITTKPMYPIKNTYSYHSSEVPTVATEEEYIADNLAEGISVDSLKGLINLQDLDLSNNSIRYLEYGIFNDLSALEILMIDLNGLEFIQDGVFQNQYKLRILSLSGNALSELSRTMFENLRTLEVLRLNNNRIVDISPLTGVHTFSLLELYLNDNQITVIAPPGFTRHENIEQLYLGNNRLKHVPEVRNLSHLSILNLEVNRIKEILPVRAFEGTSLTKLYLSDNHLKSLPYESFNYLSTLMMLVVEGNRYICDCRLQWLLDYGSAYYWFNTNEYGYVDQMVVCESPSISETKTLYDAYVAREGRKFQCTEYADPHRVMLLLTSWSGVVAFALAVFWVYTYFDFRRRFYFKTSKKRYRLLHSSDENDNISLTGRNSKVRFRSFDSDIEGYAYDEETTV